jgi:hypothetical protein
MNLVEIFKTPNKINKRMMLRFLALVCFSFLSVSIYATTWNCASASYSDVAAQADSTINTSLADGDTVVIPAGTATLSSTSNVSFGTNVITVCVWLWWDAFNQNDNLFNELSSNFNSNNNTFNVDPNSGTNSKFAASIQGVGGTYRSESITRPSAAAWHHYAFVLDNSTSAGAVKFYVDGVLTTPTVDTNTKNNSANFLTSTIYVMSRANTSLFAAGRLYSYRIYPGELTSGQVTTVMKDPK